MRASTSLGRIAAAAILSLTTAATAAAQSPPPTVPPTPATHVSIEDAVRLALAHNHGLRAQRLDVDLARADEITAALKPNPVLTSTNENFPIFSPGELFSKDNFLNNQNFVESVSYLFERGGKRRNRTLVAQGTTEVTAFGVHDAGRQLEFQARQAFIDILLAKSTRDFARQNLEDFSHVVEVNQARMKAGDLAEVELYRIQLQKLQFEQDVSSSEVALVQAKATLRQAVGFEALAEDFDVDGDLVYTAYGVTLDDLKREALAARPDLRQAQAGVKLAEANQALAFSNRARDITGGVEYDRAASLSALGFSISFDLPIHDRNQGNIARSKVAVQQAGEQAVQATSVVLTDVLTAYATFQTSEHVLSLYASGYLSQAQQSRDITAYVYQRGNGTLLDLLDAERTYRETQLAYRQALAAYMTAVEQVNFAAGKRVLQ